MSPSGSVEDQNSTAMEQGLKCAPAAAYTMTYEGNDACVHIQLPLVSSVASLDVELDAATQTLTVDSAGVYTTCCIVLPAPPADEDDLNCKWDKATASLLLRFPLSIDTEELNRLNQEAAAAKAAEEEAAAAKKMAAEEDAAAKMAAEEEAAAKQVAAEEAAAAKKVAAEEEAAAKQAAEEEAAVAAKQAADERAAAMAAATKQAEQAAAAKKLKTEQAAAAKKLKAEQAAAAKAAEETVEEVEEFVTEGAREEMEREEAAEAVRTAQQTAAQAKAAEAHAQKARKQAEQQAEQQTVDQQEKERADLQSLLGELPSEDELAMMVKQGTAHIEQLRAAGRAEEAEGLETKLHHLQAMAAAERSGTAVDNADGNQLQRAVEHATKMVAQMEAAGREEDAAKLGKWVTETEAQLQSVEETPAAELTSVQLKEQGNKAFKQKRFEIAIQWYTRAIRKEPEDHLLYSNRSMAHIKLRAYQLAHADASKCVKLEPAFAKGHVRLATALLNMSQYEEARLAVRAGLKVDLNCKELGKLLQDIRKHESGEHLQEAQFNGRFDSIDRQKAQQKAADAQAEAEAEAEERISDKFQKKKTTASIETERETPVGCVAGIEHTRNDLSGEIRRIWVNRHEVFLRLWRNDESMDKLTSGGRQQIMGGVFKAIGEYDKMPYGLKLPTGTMQLLCPELSEIAVEAMAKDPAQFVALIQRTVSMVSAGATEHVGCDELMGRTEELSEVSVQLGGFVIPFDEDKPVTYPSGEPVPKGHVAVSGFGNRMELYGNLRVLFMCQSLFMTMRAILAKAYEVGLLKMEEISGEPGQVNTEDINPSSS